VRIRNVYLDCEFLTANPTTTGLVSIALTDDQGVDYYAVNRDCDWQTLVWHDWMRANVVPSLPLRFPLGREENPAIWMWDDEHPDRAALKPPRRIRDDIAAYFADTDTETTHLYAYYGGQDICRLHSLWDNNWSAMPESVPCWFFDLKALAVQAGSPVLPEQAHGAHNALEDARHNRTMHQFLTTLTAPKEN
jgi:3' exoribonuclease, RNase T-like